MPHQVARWRHLAMKGKDLLLCGKDLAIEPCYEVHTELRPGGESLHIIQAGNFNITSLDPKWPTSRFIRDWRIKYTTAVGYVARTFIDADLYCNSGKEFYWERHLCFSDNSYKMVGGNLVLQGGADFDTYPPGSGFWVGSGVAFSVECDGGLEWKRSDGEEITVYTAVDDDDNY